MARWIDADALKQSIEESIFDVDDKEWYLTLLANVPSIDIVRCKECKRFGDEGWCFWRDVAIKDDDFCSYGERQTEENRLLRIGMEMERRSRR